jgi:SAM-dependent methyltransferase
MTDRAQRLLAEERARTSGDGYEAFHAPRYALLLSLCERHAPSPEARVLDIGRSPFSMTLRRRYPRAMTLGFPLPPGGDGSDMPHLVHDLNDSQHGMPLPAAEPFDLILFAEVIEHLRTAPELVLMVLRDALAPGGILICQTPNAAALHKRLKLLAGINPYERIRLDPMNPGHFREYTRSELLRIADSAGLRVVAHSFGNHFGGGGLLAPAFDLLCRLVPSFCRGQTLVLARD